MKRELKIGNSLIIINNDYISIPETGEVWMTQHEISQLFDCFAAKINANIRAILKTHVLYESDVCKTHHYENGNSVELYNLEMITALSFRVKSRNAEIFRNWLMKKAMTDAPQSSVNMNETLYSCGFSLN